MAQGLLLVLADPPPYFEEEFNAWYDTEHLPERARLPGFKTASRFTSLGDGPRYAAVYDLESPASLETVEYTACSGTNFSPWSRRTMARVHPLRLTGELVGRGRPTGPLSRLLIMTVEGLHDPSKVAHGLSASFDHRPGHLQSRVFKGIDAEPRLIALSMFAGHAVPPLDLAAFGECARDMTLAATYRPYRR